MRDSVSCHPNWFRREVGVAPRDLDLCVAEELADHRQTLTRSHGRGRESVPQVVDANALDPSAGTGALPEGLQITQRLAWQSAGGHPRVAVNAPGSSQQVHHGQANVADLRPGLGTRRVQCRDAEMMFTHFKDKISSRRKPFRISIRAARMAAMLKKIFAQETEADAETKCAVVADALRDKQPKLAAMMDAASDDVLAYMDFPREHWTQIASTNPIERVNHEIKRRADVVGIFPNDGAIVRLVGALIQETNDEWAVARRYMSLETLARVTDNPTVRLPAVAT